MNSRRKHRPLARRTLAVLALTTAALSWTATAGARAATVGVNPDITWGIPQSEVSREVSLIKQAGITWVRAGVDLSGAEYNGPGQLNMSYLSSIDYAVSTARSAGLNVLMELDRTPYWASADPSKYTDGSGMHWNPYWKYANPQDYARVAADVVGHYAAMGVHAYEVWNEPNNPSFWPSGVNAADYTALLKAAYPAIKQADPSATVAMGGLMNQGSYEYLQGMYDAGARGSYDVANFHVYPNGDPGQCGSEGGGRPSVKSFCLLDGLRSEMAANGDGSPVWITELGWSTCLQSYCVTPQQQAEYLISAFRLLGEPKYAYVQNAFVYQMRDLYWETSNASWGSSLGLFTRDWTPKPGYTALQTIANGLAGPPPATGTSGEAGSGSGSVTVPVSGAVEQTSGSRQSSGSSPSHAHTHRRGATATSPSARRFVAVSLDVQKPHRLHTRRVLAVASAASSIPHDVKLVARHRLHGRWVLAIVRVLRLSRHGRYASVLRLTRGTWRISVNCAAARSRAVVLHVR